MTDDPLYDSRNPNHGRSGGLHSSPDITELMGRSDEYLGTIINKGDCGPHHLVSDLVAALRASLQPATPTAGEPDIETLKRQVLAHERLQARIAEAIGRETWVGDLAEAVAAEVKRADDNGRTCNEAFKVLELIRNSANAVIRMPWLSDALQPATPTAGEPVADRLVDWVYLHATEGQQWPSTKTKSMLIARALQGEPTQDHADGMKAVSPTAIAGDAVAGDAKEALADIRSHYGAWRQIIEGARDHAKRCNEPDDASYLQHELDVLDRVHAALRSPDVAGDVQAARTSKPNDEIFAQALGDICDYLGCARDNEAALIAIDDLRKRSVDLTDAQLDDLRSHIRGAQPGQGTYDYELGSGWRCFHCGEMFRTWGGASLHFGKPADKRPACEPVDLAARASEPDVVDALAKTIWLAGFKRAFDRDPTDPWENQADTARAPHINTARKIIEAGFVTVDAAQPSSTEGK